MQKEFLELGIVKFSNGNQLMYIDWEVVNSLIHYMRLFNPLEDNVDKIIEEVNNLLLHLRKDGLEKQISKKLLFY